MSPSRSVAMVVVCALAIASTASAHHSFAAYDRTKQVTLDGVVKDFQWTNPHAWIQIVVTDAQGHSAEWGVECGSPNMMARSGWKRTQLVPGDTVVAVRGTRIAGG